MIRSQQVGVEINLHGRQLNSVFGLLGSNENDITKSLGWILAECDGFRNRFVNDLLPGADCCADSILLQERKACAGITDVELRGDDLHIIAEAKRGWCLPNDAQLRKYAARFDPVTHHRLLVTLSECSIEFAGEHLPSNVDSVPIRHVSWNGVLKLARMPGGTHAEKRLLQQFRAYLERIVKVQDQASNLVYVVSVAFGTPEWATASWQEFIEKHNTYFHPATGSGWPKEPPNYIGFRYSGRLQSVHHVDGWQIMRDMGAKVPGFRKGVVWEPHFVYQLGPAIRPAEPVRTGLIFRNGRVWAALDLLLTCDSIAVARDRTKERCQSD